MESINNLVLDLENLPAYSFAVSEIREIILKIKEKANEDEKKIDTLEQDVELWQDIAKTQKKVIQNLKKIHKITDEKMEDYINDINQEELEEEELCHNCNNESIEYEEGYCYQCYEELR